MQKLVETCWWPGSPAPTRLTSVSWNSLTGSLLLVDCGMLKNLRDATARAVEDGSFLLCGLVLLINTQTLNSSDRLTLLNLSLSHDQAMERQHRPGRRWNVSSIPYIADRIGQGIRRLPKLLRTQVRLLCMHKSGRVVSNGPPAPPSPNKQLMLSTEVDSYLRTVAETALVAIDLWQPGQAKTTPLKRLQSGAKKGKTHSGGAQGKGHSKGSRGRGGYRGGGSGGRGGSNRGGRGPTIINSGIHYHKW